MKVYLLILTLCGDPTMAIPTKGDKLQYWHWSQMDKNTEALFMNLMHQNKATVIEVYGGSCA